MREAVPRPPPLREEGTRLLRTTLPPAVRQPLLRVQPSHRWRWSVPVLSSPLIASLELALYLFMCSWKKMSKT